MLRFVVIEIRKNLSCANVFLTFEESVDDLRINVEEQLVRLKNSSDITVAEVNVAKYFTILTETFSNLVIDHENISFRISVQNIQDLEELPELPQTPKFRLEENKLASLLCKQCEAIVCDERSYEKIREFPSGSIDICDFFCHHGPSFSNVLLPRSSDMFYGFQFIVLNRQNVENTTKDKNGHIYCQRCSRYFGELMLDDKAVKIWSDSLTIRLGSTSQLMDVFATEQQHLPEMLMLKVIKESSLPAPEPLLRNMHFTKVLLDTCLPNRYQQYLLVHILEKNLCILKNDEAIEDIQNNSDDDCFIHHLKVEVRMRKAFKLLYKLVEVGRTDSDDDESNKSPILGYWQQDINILKMKISPFLFQQLLCDLNVNSLLIPEIYRDNKDHFTLSYIFQ